MRGRDESSRKLHLFLFIFLFCSLILSFQDACKHEYTIIQYSKFLFVIIRKKTETTIQSSSPTQTSFWGNSLAFSTFFLASQLYNVICIGRPTLQDFQFWCIFQTGHLLQVLDIWKVLGNKANSDNEVKEKYVLFSSFEKLWCLHKLQRRFKIGSKIPSYQGHIFPFLRKYYQIWPTYISLLSLSTVIF